MPTVSLCHGLAGAIGERVDANHRLLLISIVCVGNGSAHCLAGGYCDTVSYVLSGGGSRHSRTYTRHSRESVHVLLGTTEDGNPWQSISGVAPAESPPGQFPTNVSTSAGSGLLHCRLAAATRPFMLALDSVQPSVAVQRHWWRKAIQDCTLSAASDLNNLLDFAAAVKRWTGPLQSRTETGVFGRGATPCHAGQTEARQVTAAEGAKTPVSRARQPTSILLLALDCVQPAAAIQCQTRRIWQSGSLETV